MAGPAAKHATTQVSRLVQGAPRFPLWACATCGGGDNWGDRSACRHCHSTPPAPVVRRQREAVSGRKQGGGNGGGGGGGGGGNGRAASRATSASNNKNSGGGGGGGNDGGGGGGGPGGKGASTSTVANVRSYAAVVAQGPRGAQQPANPSAGEVAELRRANERLAKQLTELRAAHSTATTAAGDDTEDVDDEEGGSEQREEKIKVLQTHLKSVAAVFGEESVEYTSKRGELDALLKAKREEKHLKTQLHNADRRIERLRGRVQKADACVGQLCTRIAELRDDLEAAEHDLDEAKAQLAGAEEDRKALLLREAQAAQSDPPSDGQAAKHGHGETEWQRMVDVIGERVTQPGVRHDLASQITSALQVLRGLCWQLPAPPAPVDNAAGAHPMAAGSGAPPAAPAAVASGEQDATAATRALAKEMAEQIKTDMAATAAVRQRQGAQPAQPAALSTPPSWPAPPSQPVQSSSTEPSLQAPAAPARGAAGAADGTTAQPASSSRAGEPQAAASGAPAPPTPVAADAGDLGENGPITMDVAEDSEGLTDEEENGIKFFEEALAATPEEQRARLKEILDKRRHKLEQRRGDPKRRKHGRRWKEGSAAEDGKEGKQKS